MVNKDSGRVEKEVDLDIVMMWKARFSMSFYVKLRCLLKALSAAARVVVLPTTYSYSWNNPSGIEETVKNWFGNGPNSPLLFIIAVVIYLSPNILSEIVFLLPFIRWNLERSDYKIVNLVMWWSQMSLYVGRGMHEDLVSFIKYDFASGALAITAVTTHPSYVGPGSQDGNIITGKCHPSGFTRRLNRRHGSVVLAFVVDEWFANFLRRQDNMEHWKFNFGEV